MKFNTNRGDEMTATQTRTMTEIQQDIDNLSAKAANIWSREESRKFADTMRTLKEELKKATRDAPMASVENIYADLKLADRMTPGRTPWQTLRKRAEDIAAREGVTDADRLPLMDANGDNPLEASIVRLRADEDRVANLIEALKRENIIRDPYERTTWAYWLTDGTQRFLSFRDDSVRLMQWTPGINDQVDVLAMDQATVETVACLL